MNIFQISADSSSTPASRAGSSFSGPVVHDRASHRHSSHPSGDPQAGLPLQTVSVLKHEHRRSGGGGRGEVDGKQDVVGGVDVDDVVVGRRVVAGAHVAAELGPPIPHVPLQAPRR